MTQSKAAVKTEADQPRDEDGRFTDKGDAKTLSSGSRSKDEKTKPAVASSGGQKDTAGKSSTGKSKPNGSKSR